MARIRTIKPSLFRHEKLQELEEKNPGKNIILVFIGLWGHCDSNGVFEFRPKMLALDILPFLSFKIAETLEILEGAGFLTKYTVGDCVYGCIPTFKAHQRITGKELTEGKKYPILAQGNTSETPVKHTEPQEQEQEQEQEGRGKIHQGNTNPKKHTFKNSPFYNFDEFKKHLKLNEFKIPENVSAEFYYKRACSGNYLYSNWIEAVINWINEDNTNGTLNGKKNKTAAAKKNIRDQKTTAL